MARRRGGFFGGIFRFWAERSAQSWTVWIAGLQFFSAFLLQVLGWITVLGLIYMFGAAFGNFDRWRLPYAAPNREVRRRSVRQRGTCR